LMAASATFALKAGVWFRRGRLLMVSPDSRSTACPPSGRNSTYPAVQICRASSLPNHREELYKFNWAPADREGVAMQARRASKWGAHMISHSTRGAILASAFAALMVAAVPSANAESKFDGAWSIAIVTKAGACQNYHFVVQIINGVFHYAALSPNNYSGRVAPGGALSVTGSLGTTYGVASGRLSGSSGRGSWHLHMPDAVCSGVWSAQRD
jgi:hypothetical protein